MNIDTEFNVGDSVSKRGLHCSFNYKQNNHRNILC